MWVLNHFRMHCMCSTEVMNIVLLMLRQLWGIRLLSHWKTDQLVNVSELCITIVCFSLNTVRDQMGAKGYNGDVKESHCFFFTHYYDILSAVLWVNLLTLENHYFDLFVLEVLVWWFDENKGYHFYSTPSIVVWWHPFTPTEKQPFDYWWFNESASESLEVEKVFTWYTP